MKSYEERMEAARIAYVDSGGDLETGIEAFLDGDTVYVKTGESKPASPVHPYGVKVPEYVPLQPKGDPLPASMLKVSGIDFTLDDEDSYTEVAVVPYVEKGDA